jgi:hypothetical protein
MSPKESEDNLIAPDRPYPKRNFHFVIQGDESPILNEIPVESSLGTLIKHNIALEAERKWLANAGPDGPQDGATIEIPVEQANSIAREVIRQYEQEKEQQLNRMGRDMSTTLPPQPVFGEDEPYTTLRRQEDRRFRQDAEACGYQRARRMRGGY